METITKKSVRNRHIQQQANGNNNHNNLIQIVDIFGGIDEILTNYLSESSNISIAQTQLIQLKELLETSPQSQELTDVNKNQFASDAELNDIYYSLQNSDTYLHDLFGTQKAAELLQLFHNNISTIVVLSCMALSVVVEFFVQNKIIYILYIITMLIVLCPYGVFLMLSINRKGFKLVLSTFEFWYKLINGITQSVCDVWIDCLDHDNYDAILIKISTRILILVAIIYVSSLDTIHDDVGKWKIIYSVAMGSCYLIGTIFHQLNVYHNPEEMYLIKVWYFQFSLQLLSLNAWRTLMVFFWKQAIVSVITYENGKCVSIKCTPSIKWNDDQEKPDEIYCDGDMTKDESNSPSFQLNEQTIDDLMLEVENIVEFQNTKNHQKDDTRSNEW